MYVSGDNAPLDLVTQIAERFTVNVAVLFAGAAKAADALAIETT